MQGEFSTSDVEQRDRFAYWNDLVCDVFVHLDCRSPVASSFNAGMRYASLDWLRVVEAESDAIEAIRSGRQIAKGHEDDLLISLQVQGQTVVVQDGREALLKAGDFALYDSERPYRLLMSEGTELVCLQFPRAQLESRLGNIAPLVARAAHGSEGVGSLFMQMVRALHRRSSEISSSDAPAVADHVLDLLTLALRSGADGAPKLSSARAVTLAHLKKVVRSHLRNPDLDPAGAAARAGISKRHANRLLALEGTSLERFIFSSRLDCCHAALRDRSLDRQTISEIAFAWGFSDFSHFSRSFRSRYGLSPSEYRKMARERGDH